MFMLLLSIHKMDRMTRLICRGRIREGSEATILREFATEILYKDQKLVIDFTSVQYIDDAGFRTLDDLRRLAESLGRQYMLVNMRAGVLNHEESLVKL